MIWIALFLIGIGAFALVVAVGLDDIGGGEERSAWSGRAELALGVFGVLAMVLGLILLIDAILTI